MKLDWSLRAQSDLFEIGDFIARDDPKAARRFVQRLRRRAQQVRRFPLSGRVVPEFGQASIREVIEGNYRIVYEVSRSNLVVLTVRESHRLMPSIKP